MQVRRGLTRWWRSIFSPFFLVLRLVVLMVVVVGGKDVLLAHFVRGTVIGGTNSSSPSEYTE